MLFLKLSKPCIQQFLNILTFKESILDFYNIYSNISGLIISFLLIYSVALFPVSEIFGSLVTILVSYGCCSKVSQTEQLKQQKFIFSHSSGNYKFKIKVSAELILPESWRKNPFQASLFGLRWTTSPHVFMSSSLCLCPCPNFPFL